VSSKAGWEGARGPRRSRRLQRAEMGQKSHRRASKSVMLSFCITHAGLRVARQAGRVHVALGAVGDSRGRQWGEKSSKSICKGYNVVLDRLGGCASSETGWEGARGPGSNR